jgi:hypothetical protein
MNIPFRTNNRTTPGARPLALLASLSLAATGLLGIALAPAASAVDPGVISLSVTGGSDPNTVVASWSDTAAPGQYEASWWQDCGSGYGAESSAYGVTSPQTLSATGGCTVRVRMRSFPPASSVLLSESQEVIAIATSAPAPTAPSPACDGVWEERNSATGAGSCTKSYPVCWYEDSYNSTTYEMHRVSVIRFWEGTAWADPYVEQWIDASTIPDEAVFPNLTVAGGTAFTAHGDQSIWGGGKCDGSGDPTPPSDDPTPGPAAPSTAAPQAAPAPVVDYCPDVTGVQWENYDCLTGISAPAAPVAVVEAAVAIAAPAAATLPATKPAATVAVPAAATIPTAVPAGDGSSAPSSLPMWVMALATIGVLAAAGATRKMAGARTE